MSHGGLTTEDTMNGSALAELKRSLDTQENRLNQTSSDLNALAQVVQRIEAKLNSLSDAFTSSRTPNWATILAALVFFGTLIAGGWAVIGMKTSEATAPVASDVATLKAQAANTMRQYELIVDQLNRLSQQTLSSADADQRSDTDRRHLNDMQHEMEGKIAALSSLASTLDANIKQSLGEVEGQFRAIGQIENLRWAHQERWNCTQYEDTHTGRHCAADPWYPTSLYKDHSG